MKSLRALNKYLWKYRWHLGLGLIFIIVSDLYGVWSQVYVREGVNAIATHNSIGNVLMFGIKQESEFYSIILNFILMYFLINLIKGFFLFCQRQTIIVMSRRI